VVAAVLAVWASMRAIGRPALTAPRATGPSPAPTVVQEAQTARVPPAFSPAEGWNVRTSGTVPPGSRDLPVALAANVPMAEQDLAAIAAHGLTESSAAATLASLPSDGVVIIAVLPFAPGNGPAPPHFGDFPDRRLPLRLSDARVNRQWQSQPRPNAPEYDVWGRVEGAYVEVSIYFGTPKPAPATYASAQAELARLVLPSIGAGATPSAALWTTGNAGTLTIQTPPGWTFSGNPSPHVEIAEGNWPFPNEDSCGPKAALRAMPRDGALLWVSELVLGRDEGGLSARPARFTLAGRRPIPRECPGTSYLIRFSDQGRAFEARIVFGPNASRTTRAEAMRSLSSLRVGFGAG
jgi:hypothetical protein